MRLAILTDIHGNREALTAVLADPLTMAVNGCESPARTFAVPGDVTTVIAGGGGGGAGLFAPLAQPATTIEIASKQVQGRLRRLGIGCAPSANLSKPRASEKVPKNCSRAVV